MSFTVDVDGRKIFSEIDFKSPDPRYVLITPKMAKLILETMNTSNRPFKPTSIGIYVDDMVGGRWTLTGNSISFRYLDETCHAQVLCDGQNRLQSVIKSGVAVVSIVVCRLPANSFEKTDHGKRRSFADELHIRGEKHCSTLQGAVRAFYRYAPERLGGRAGIITRSLPDESLRDLLERNPGLRHSAEMVKGRFASLLKGRKGFFPHSTLAALHYLTSLKDADKATDFAERVISCSMLMPNSPELCLNKKLNENMASREKLDDWFLAAFYLIAWNAAVAGRELKLLRINIGQSFPDVI